MRIFTFFVLFFMSIATFAQGPSEPSEKRFAASMKKDVKNLILEGKNEVKTIKDRELNRYFVALLKDKENIINGTLGLSSGYYGDKTQAQRRDFYQNILKGSYRDIMSQIHSNNSTRTLDTNKKQEIEGAFLSYQKDVVANISDQLIKAINMDTLQKGSMSFSYESGSSYLRVKLQDYKITQSLKRDEQTMSFTLKADYNLDIPGKEICDYDDTWKYSCTDASGTHISGYSMAKIEYSRFGADLYFQISDFDMKAEITGMKKAEIDSVISNLRGYMNGKTYHMKASEGMNGVSTMEMLEKGGSLLKLLQNTSVFTPVIQVGNEYVLNWNPSFVTKFNTITGNNSKPSGYMFPEFRYKDGVFFLNYADSDTTIVTLQIAKNSEAKSIGSLNIHDVDMKNSLAITLGKGLWKMNLNTPELIINSDWNGETTLTEISGSGLSEIFHSFMYGYSPPTKIDESMLPKKIRIYGNLTANSVSLKFDADNSTFATIDSFTNGSNSNYRAYFNMFTQKFEVAGDLSQDYGTFVMTKPLDAIELDIKKSGKLQKSLGDLSDRMISR